MVPRKKPCPSATGDPAGTFCRKTEPLTDPAIPSGRVWIRCMVTLCCAVPEKVIFVLLLLFRNHFNEIGES